MSKEGEDVYEANSEFKVLEQLEALETGMLLSGENDARDAIITIDPGAGGTESRTGPRCSSTCRGMGGEKRLPVVYYGPAGEGAGIKSVTFEMTARTFMDVCICIPITSFNVGHFSTPTPGATLHLHHVAYTRRSKTT